MTEARVPINDYRAQAEAYQARRQSYMAAGDLDGLVNNLYTEDARLDTFDFRARGRAAVKGVIEMVGSRLAGRGPARVEKFAAGRDFIWQELAFGSGETAVKPYEFKFLRDGQVYLQLYGFKEGTLWRPGEFDDQPVPDAQEAVRLHDRYLGYHVNGDADGLVDQFFTDDARLVTSNLAVEGREALRGVFRELFAKEQGFRPLSLERIAGAPDYVWFEATVVSSLGRRSLYDVQLLREGRVSLQIVGQLQGAAPTEAAHIER